MRGGRAQSWFARDDRRDVSTTFDDRETAASRRLTAALGLRLHGAVRTVLDVGCGGGELLCDLLELDPGLRVVGIDPAPEAVAAARARHAGDERVTIVQTSAEGLDDAPAAACLPANGVDLAICHLNLGLWDDPAAGLGRVLARLAPAGVLYLVDVAAPETGRERDAFLDLARSPDERRYLADQLAATYRPDELRDRVPRAAATATTAPAQTGGPPAPTGGPPAPTGGPPESRRDPPSRFETRVARGGLAGYPYESPEAGRLWTDPAVQRALAGFDDDPAAADKAASVLYAVVRRA